MKLCTFEELYTLDFELTDIFAQKQKWIDGILFERRNPRKTGAFIYLNGCTGQYTDLVSGKTFYAPVKSFVYLPYGGKYTVLNIESQKAPIDAYLVEFNIVTGGQTVSLADAPVMIENVSPYYIEKTMAEIVSDYESVEKSPSVLKSKIYELMAYVSNFKESNKGRIGNVLKPAIKNIESNPFNLCSIEELAKMCGLSSGGFRRIFKQYTGKSPKEYILDIKISTAKRLLEESNMSVSRIAEILNFDTTAYFSRFFKKKTQISPKEYRILCNRSK